MIKNNVKRFKEFIEMMFAAEHEGDRLPDFGGLDIRLIKQLERTVQQADANMQQLDANTVRGQPAERVWIDDPVVPPVIVQGWESKHGNQASS